MWMNYLGSSNSHHLVTFKLQILILCHCYFLSFRWFWHFYAISVVWNGLLLGLYLKFILQHQSYPAWLTGILDTLTSVPSPDSQGKLRVLCCFSFMPSSPVLFTLKKMLLSSVSTVPQLSTVLVQLLLCIHSLRRLLECLFVSIFSDGAIHVVQYIFGLGYYILLGLTVHCSDRAQTG